MLLTADKVKNEKIVTKKQRRNSVTVPLLQLLMTAENVFLLSNNMKVYLASNVISYLLSTIYVYGMEQYAV